METEELVRDKLELAQEYLKRVRKDKNQEIRYYKSLIREFKKKLRDMKPSKTSPNATKGL